MSTPASYSANVITQVPPYGAIFGGIGAGTVLISIGYLVYIVKYRRRRRTIRRQPLRPLVDAGTIMMPRINTRRIPEVDTKVSENPLQPKIDRIEKSMSWKPKSMR